MLDQVSRVLSLRASEKGLSLYCCVPDEIPDALLGDRRRLQQILLNLVGNAIKFTERGEVAVGLLVSPLTEGEGSVMLKFAVRDTGIGIPPVVQERLFQPFAQADTSVARQFGGTGLGLSICKRLVELMGGRIWIESEVGRGSTFHFTVCLPLAKELRAEFEAPTTISSAACAPLRILLVEDNPANQKVVRYFLQERGHRVEIASDGQAAIDLTGQHRYDVVLMDVQLLETDGLEATATIRAREQAAGDGGSRRVPIIGMTASVMRGDEDRCLAAGMDGYLSKPVNMQAMIGLVEGLARDAVDVVNVAAETPSPAETSPQATAVDFSLFLKYSPRR
jgi:CheY-like chemotaxis protein